jgi:hypothetical protein
MPQLEAASRSTDPQVASSVKNLIAEISSAAKVASVRRLMAIRTLGELKHPDALPLLRPLLDSKEMFVAEYAARAIAELEGKPPAGEMLTAEQRLADVWLLPAECRFVSQQVMWAPPRPIDKVLEKLPMLPGGPGKEKLADDLTRNVIRVAEQIGDVRIDAVTMGISGEIGNDNGFVTIIVRAVYDASAAQAALRKLQVASKNVAGTEAFTPDPHVALILASNERVVVVAGPKEEKMPVAAVVTALRDGKGALAAVREMTQLIQATDTKQALWGVASITDAYRQADLLQAFSSLSFVGQREGEMIILRVTANGDDAGKVKTSVQEVNQSVAQSIAELERTAKTIPFVTPILEIMRTVRCEARDTSATLTATLQGDSALLTFPMLFGYSTGEPVPAPAPPEAVKAK